MRYLVKDAQVFLPDGLIKADILISDGFICRIGQNIADGQAAVIDAKGLTVFPGFTDVHVHFRQPGFCYKETIFSGSRAAAAGGYTSVCTMPNLNPVPDCPDSVIEQLDIIKRDAVIDIYPYAAITRGQRGEQLCDFKALMPYAVAFSDDGRGVQSGEVMKRALELSAETGALVAAHCEVNSLLRGGYINEGEYSRRHGMAGICAESEWRMIERDLELLSRHGGHYHVCHVSTAESVELIRSAKRSGLDVTCETAPHYLILCDDDLIDHGRFKMNPPLRSKRDRQALLDGVNDKTVDILATDHAPHSEQEKSRGLKGSAFGVVGLETAFAACYTKLVKRSLVELPRLVEMLTEAPQRRFKIEGGLYEGAPASLTAFDLNEQYTVDPARFLSKGRATVFEGERLFGRCAFTMCRGKTAYQYQAEK